MNKRSVKKYGRKKSMEPRKKSVRHKISRRKPVDKRKKSLRKKSASKRKKSVKRKSFKRRKRDGMDEEDEPSIIKPTKLDFESPAIKEVFPPTSDNESSVNELETPKRQLIFTPDKRPVGNDVLESLANEFSESIFGKPDSKTLKPEPPVSKVDEPKPEPKQNLKRDEPDIPHDSPLSPPPKKPKIMKYLEKKT
jgi:hypothetical protein